MVSPNAHPRKPDVATEKQARMDRAMNARPLPAATPGTIDVNDVSLKAGLRACKRCECISLITFPCKAQWSIDQVWLAYRCGGSAGFVDSHDQERSKNNAPASRFTRSNDQAPLAARSVTERPGMENREWRMGRSAPGMLGAFFPFPILHSPFPAFSAPDSASHRRGRVGSTDTSGSRPARGRNRLMACNASARSGSG